VDETDQRLIAALRRDGRASLSDLAAALGVARATARSRIERLVARGEISGFTVLTRTDVTAAPVRGLMMLGIEGRRHRPDHRATDGAIGGAGGAFDEWKMGSDRRNRHPRLWRSLTIFWRRSAALKGLPPRKPI